MHSAAAESDMDVLGEKVLIRLFNEGDITTGYIGWLNDPLTMRFSNQRFFTHNRESSLRYLQSFKNSHNLFFSVRDKKTGLPLGTMTAYVAPHHGTADIGILIGERSIWGQGYGVDAWSTLLQWLFQRCDLRKVTAGTLACNQAMLRLMYNSGMITDGIRHAQEIVDGIPQDMLYFARFRDA